MGSFVVKEDGGENHSPSAEPEDWSLRRRAQSSRGTRSCGGGGRVEDLRVLLVTTVLKGGMC